MPVTEAHNKNKLRVIDKATTFRVSDQINKSNLSLINSEINNTSCIINHPCDSEQCNASVLNRNQVDLTNDVSPSSKQQLVQQEQSSVSRVNDYSVNVLNKNYFELRNDDMLLPKQSLAPGELPSVKVNDVLPLNQQKENKQQDENINVNLRSKPREKTNNVGRKNDYDPSLKRSTSCPFLVRRGRCLKGNQCDFKHSSSEPLKHNIPCPFLRNRGYCLKDNQCDFSHDELLQDNPSLRPYPRPRSYPDSNTYSFFPHRPATVSQHMNSDLFPPPHFQNYYYWEPGKNLPVPNPVKGFPIPVWPQQTTYLPHPHPLMEIPFHRVSRVGQ